MLSLYILTYRYLSKAHRHCQREKRVVCVLTYGMHSRINSETLEFAYCDAHYQYVLLMYTEFY